MKTDVGFLALLWINVTKISHYTRAFLYREFQY